MRQSGNKRTLEFLSPFLFLHSSTCSSFQLILPIYLQPGPNRLFCGCLGCTFRLLRGWGECPKAGPNLKNTLIRSSGVERRPAFYPAECGPLHGSEAVERRRGRMHRRKRYWICGNNSICCRRGSGTWRIRWQSRMRLPKPMSPRTKRVGHLERPREKWMPSHGEGGGGSAVLRGGAFPPLPSSPLSLLSDMC